MGFTRSAMGTQRFLESRSDLRPRRRMLCITAKPGEWFENVD